MCHYLQQQLFFFFFSIANYLFTIFVYTITIIRQLDDKSIQICFVLCCIWQSKRTDECSWRRMFQYFTFPKSLYKYKHYCYCLCILFTFVLVVLFVDFCKHVYTFFMLVFVIKLSSTIICKQVFFTLLF